MSEASINMLVGEISRLKAENKKILEALDIISTWSTHTAQFSIDYGSNGVRDFYRGIAERALKEAVK